MPKRKIVLAIGLLAVFALAFAAVPVYQHLAGGHGQHDGQQANQEAPVNIDGIVIDRSREINLRLVAKQGDSTDWEFAAQADAVKLHPGDIQTYYYRVKNLTPENMVIQAVPQVLPTEASSYLRKMECFCFSAQPLAPGEEAQLFVSLYIHEKLPPEFTEMTLSYSLLDITETVDFEEVSGRDPIGRGQPAADVDYTKRQAGGGHDEQDGHGSH